MDGPILQCRVSTAGGCGSSPSRRSHDIARVALRARVVTNLALVKLNGRPAILAGLENGQLVLVRDRS